MYEPSTIEEIDEQYEENAAILLERIAQRDEMVQLLKLATPDKADGVREVIAGLDKSIEATEELLEILDKARNLKRESDAATLKLYDKTMMIEKEMRAYFAEHAPEKLELLDAMLEDDGKSH